jgi:hypothetical protein
MAFTWLYSKPVYPALLPFAVYSTFHFLTYLRTNLIPTIMPSAPGAPQPAIAETIARFVKKNYDASMHLVANLELFLWARVFLWCLVLRNSWVLLVVYSFPARPLRPECLRPRRHEGRRAPRRRARH